MTQRLPSRHPPRDTDPQIWNWVTERFEPPHCDDRKRKTKAAKGPPKDREPANDLP
jgi:hypothetical protein